MTVVLGVLYSERHDVMDPCCLAKINQGITLTRAVACSRITFKSLGGSSVSRHLYPIVSTYIFASGCPSVRHHRKNTPPSSVMYSSCYPPWLSSCQIVKRIAMRLWQKPSRAAVQSSSCAMISTSSLNILGKKNFVFSYTKKVTIVVGMTRSVFGTTLQIISDMHS